MDRKEEERLQSAFDAVPKRMTRKWLQARTDRELKRLLARWTERCSRGHQIQQELETREEMRMSYRNEQAPGQP